MMKMGWFDFLKKEHRDRQRKLRQKAKEAYDQEFHQAIEEELVREAKRGAREDAERRARAYFNKDNVFKKFYRNFEQFSKEVFVGATGIGSRDVKEKKNRDDKE